MSAVTTWDLLPSVHAPIEGERVLRLTGSITLVSAPAAYVPDIPAWHVLLRDGYMVYVDPTKVQGYWREISP